MTAYLLPWPDDVFLRKADVRGVYDGGIFYKKADEYVAKREAERKAGHSGLLEHY